MSSAPIIVIAMAGLSKRFTDAGYELPKYMLELGGRSLFQHAVGSFERYFDSAHFVLVLRDVAGTLDFVAREVEVLGIADASLVVLEEMTRGQAETVAMGLERAGVGPDAGPLIIHNIDTFRPGYRLPEAAQVEGWDGYLEVVEAEGDGWSFALPRSPDSTEVVRTTEKVRISDLCSTGLYHFRQAGSFLDAFEQSAEDSAAGEREMFVAPLYNRLISAGQKVHYVKIEPSEVIFCGVPAEYEALLANER